MTDVQLIHGSFGTPETIDGRVCLVTLKSDRGVVMYGPYEERQPGRYQVQFELGYADGTKPLGDPICAKIEILTNAGGTMLAQRWLLHSELSQGLAAFDLAVTFHEPRKLEYRVQSNGQVPLNISDTVRVSSIAGEAAPPAPRGSQQRMWENERELLDGYLRNISGVIHVGANLGQERRYYWLLGLDVIWIEPIREVYDSLVNNIALYPRQRAYHALLADKAGEEVVLGIANNGGASSSLLALEDHKEIFPDIHYVEHRKMISTTLEALAHDHKIRLADYQALTIDTEGAELMVLQGAAAVLGHFEYVKCEVADFPARSGNPSTAQLDALLTAAGFAQIARREFGMGPHHEGTYWDIVWKKVRPGETLGEPGYKLPVVMDPEEVVGIEKNE